MIGDLIVNLVTIVPVINLQVKFLAQFTKTSLHHLLWTGFHVVIVFPPKVLVVMCFVGVQHRQVFSKLLRFKQSGVNVRVRWSYTAVVSTTVHYWNHFARHDPKELFRNVICADRVFEWQVKFVARLENIMSSFLWVSTVIHMTNIKVTTVSIGVDFYVAFQLADIVLSMAVSSTVRCHPNQCWSSIKTRSCFISVSC